jgi:hypothetical protein
MFYFFLNLFLMPETIPENLEIVLKARKITRNPGKFPELDWGMNNPDKVFGAHEKYFRAF